MDDGQFKKEELSTTHRGEDNILSRRGGPFSESTGQGWKSNAGEGARVAILKRLSPYLNAGFEREKNG